MEPVTAIGKATSADEDDINGGTGLDQCFIASGVFGLFLDERLVFYTHKRLGNICQDEMLKCCEI
jgi:hypothetical protein